MFRGNQLVRYQAVENKEDLRPLSIPFSFRQISERVHSNFKIIIIRFCRPTKTNVLFVPNCSMVTFDLSYIPRVMRFVQNNELSPKGKLFLFRLEIGKLRNRLDVVGRYKHNKQLLNNCSIYFEVHSLVL